MRGRTYFKSMVEFPGCQRGDCWFILAGRDVPSRLMVMVSVGAMKMKRFCLQLAEKQIDALLASFFLSSDDARVSVQIQIILEAQLNPTLLAPSVQWLEPSLF